MTDTPPIRLCCGQSHSGVVCPDGRFMCCLCFDRLDRGADGPLWVGDADHVRDLNGNTIGTWSVQGE